MALSCGAKCAKGLLIVFNLIFWLSGCALLGIGVYILIEEEKTVLFRLFAVDERHALLQYLAYALIGVGGLVFVVGFFGCCGAIRESRCMLVTYFIFLFLILGAELAIGILAVVFQDKTIEEMEEQLVSTLKEKYGANDPLTEAIDLAQTKFRCCGIRGPDDYAQSKWKIENMAKGDIVSKTCCLLRNSNETEAHKNPRPMNETMCQSEDSELNLSFRHQTGCLMKLEEFIRTESKLVIFLGCGVAGLEIFGMIFAICLCKEI